MIFLFLVRYFESKSSKDLSGPREDLINLMRSQSKIETDFSDEDSGIPPLIQAITRSAFATMLSCHTSHPPGLKFFA